MSERGQALIEFSFTVGLLMLLVVATAQVAIFLNYRSSLELATREAGGGVRYPRWEPDCGHGEHVRTRDPADTVSTVQPPAGASALRPHH